MSNYTWEHPVVAAIRTFRGDAYFFLPCICALSSTENHGELQWQS